MKFLHLSDLHLGKRVHGFSMLEDQRFVLEQIVQMAKQQRADAVVIAGDIYDKSIPPAEAVGLFDSFFTSLGAAGIPVLAISGNHDAGDRLNFGQRLLARQGVHLSGTFDGCVQAVTLRDADGCAVQFHLLPWLRPSELRERLGLAESTQQCAVQAALEQLEWDAQARHVLLAHAFVTVGGALPEQSESEVVPVGGLDAVDVALFDRF
ncbi:MAG TPA: exonuclease sbcCD subunit D, partial [Clostridiales bacterium]|nr:exonuclease sbcCD subunit D [Clostridiales bacterium]